MKTDWIQTYSGLKFYPMEPRACDVRIEDIAHSLSLLCRFGGHCKRFYSVAQHSVLVSLNSGHPMHGLLHDAEEAYLADICRPVKRSLRWMGIMAIDDAAEALTKAIFDKFEVRWTEESREAVKEADNILLSTEARDLMAHMEDGTLWTSVDRFTPLETEIIPVGPEEAERMFLSRFNELRAIMSQGTTAVAQRQSVRLISGRLMVQLHPAVLMVSWSRSPKCSLGESNYESIA